MQSKLLKWAELSKADKFDESMIDPEELQKSKEDSDLMQLTLKENLSKLNQNLQNNKKEAAEIMDQLEQAKSSEDDEKIQSLEAYLL